MLKKCNKCGMVKDIDDFYKNRNTNDGHEIRCKYCCKKHNKEYYHENRKRLRKYSAKYRENNSEKVKKYHTENRSKIRLQQIESYAENPEVRKKECRKWRKTETGRRFYRDYYVITKKEYPEKIRARYEVSCAIKSGELNRGRCTVCNGKYNIHAHHDDYFKPLDIDWLCPGCHKLWHLLLNEWKRQAKGGEYGFI